MSTSAQLPLCVYCGTARPADRSQCPQCGRPWIDVRVGAYAEAKVPAGVGAAIAAETPGGATVAVTEPPAQPGEQLTVDLTSDEPDERPSSFRLPIAIVLTVSATAVFAMFAFGLLDGGEDVDGASTTASVPTTTPPTSTTLPPTTTAPPATTTVPTTTIPEPASIAAAGDPVELSRLTLKADGIGPIDIGSPAPEALGRLAASLGTPDMIGAAGAEYGLCAGADGRIVRWAELTAVIDGTIATGSFVGFRFEEPAVPTSHVDLATPSGLRLGDDLRTLNEVYARYDVVYETIGEASAFYLYDGDELLLWGPISSAEETGRVEGIYSPPPCVAS